MVMHTHECKAVGTLAEALPPRPCWADLADSSQEASQDRMLLPPLLENSYDSPAAGLDNSKDGLNGRLAEAAQLKSAPKDFSFLLSSIVGKVENDMASTPPSVRSSADTFDATRRFSNKSVQKNLFRLDSNADSVDLAVPSDQASGMNKRSRRGKRALSQNQVPAIKRTRDDETASSTDGRPTLPIPEATEEEWHHRFAKRERAVNTIKASKDYSSFIELRPRQCDRLEGEPQTPTAQDRTTSKRRWEWEVQQWRVALRQWCLEHVQEQSDEQIQLAVENNRD